MEELTSALATSFQVTFEPNSTAAPHPRYSMYKLKTSSQSQSERRRKILDLQKKRRFDFVNHARKVAEGRWEDDSEGGDNMESAGQESASNDTANKEKKDECQISEEKMEVTAGFKKPGRYYKDQLMMSEWLVEVPSDFTEEWMMILCPVARRRLVVASKGITVAYSKGGFRTNNFPSHLPGGNKRQSTKYRDYCILDCLHDEAAKTFYVLDLMCWKSLPIYDSETEFRSYWLHEKMNEVPEVMQNSKINPYKFIPLPSFPCTPEAIAEALSAANFEVDGVLFFHKRTHYTFGSTPLVVWLKPYMVPDVLNIAVPQKMMAVAPPSYVNYAKHMEEVIDNKHVSDEMRQKGATPNKGRRQRRQEKGMEVGEVGDVSVSDVSTDSQGFNVSGSSLDDSPKKSERGIIHIPKNFNFDGSKNGVSPFGMGQTHDVPFSGSSVTHTGGSRSGMVQTHSVQNSGSSVSQSEQFEERIITPKKSKNKKQNKSKGKSMETGESGLSQQCSHLLKGTGGVVQME